MFGFPKIEKTANFKFNKNFLKSVVFQVKYDENETILQKKDFIIDAFKNEYPNHKQIQRVGVGFTLKEDKTPIVHPQQSKENGYQFTSKSNDKLLSINTDSITLTISGNTYNNFSGLMEEINKISEIFDECDIKSFNRIAIRKSNFIEFTPEAEKADNVKPMEILPELLNNTLVQNSLMCPAFEYQKEGVYKMIFKKDNFLLNLQYGVIKTNDTPLINSLFLDIDLFTTEKKVDTSKLSEMLLVINNEIFNVFSWAVSENLVKILNS